MHEKLQYDFNKETTKTSAWLSSEVDKYEGEKILTPDQKLPS